MPRSNQPLMKHLGRKYDDDDFFKILKMNLYITSQELVRFTNFA